VPGKAAIDDTSDPNEAILRGLDYQHSWTFDVDHIVELYRACQVHPGAQALEIGSYRGHCALAMAMAGKEVTSIDVSDEHLSDRTRLIDEHGLGNRVTFVIASSDDELANPHAFDIVLHDNGRRGGKLMTELGACWKRKLNPGGILIVHNVEQIDLPRLLARLQPETHIVSSDKRGRQLGFFVKSPGPVDA